MNTLPALLILFVATGALPSPASAQKRPDFNGTWEEDVAQRKSPFDKRAPAAGGSRAMAAPPEPITITQTSERLTVARPFRDQVTRMSYDVDGRENVNRTGAQIHTTRSRWEGGSFITEGSIFQVTSQGETSWKLREVRSLTRQGEMVEEVTRVDEDGNSNTVTRVFRKKR